MPRIATIICITRAGMSALLLCALPAFASSSATGAAVSCGPNPAIRYGENDALGTGRSPYISFRAGVEASPILGFAGGLDFTFPTLSVAPDWTTRVTADVLAPFSARSFLGAPNTRLAITLDQVHGWNRTGSGCYAGAGIGEFIGGKGGFGGRLLAGWKFDSIWSIEANLDLSANNSPILAAEFRLSAL
ncbi:MAG TPA: hypothetical protein VGS41_19465 [Chthonomonadales bacterium]|nr:hypothetical protein [Chthonomonadales bacterium]